MPSCHAINCTNFKGKVKGKSFFHFPNPELSRGHKALCKKWIDNLRNAKLDINSFKFSASKVVCEDHFTKDSFVTSYTSEAAHLVNFKPRRKDLKKDAVPTLVDTGRGPLACEKARASTQSLQKKRRDAQVRIYIWPSRQMTSYQRR